MMTIDDIQLSKKRCFDDRGRGCFVFFFAMIKKMGQVTLQGVFITEILIYLKIIKNMMIIKAKTVIYFKKIFLS